MEINRCFSICHKKTKAGIVFAAKRKKEMNNTSNDSLLLYRDYALTLKTSEAPISTPKKKRHIKSNIESHHLQHLNLEDDFMDDLRDSIHLAKERMKKHRFRLGSDEHILMTPSLIEHEVARELGNQASNVKTCLKSQSRIIDLKLLETYSNKEFIPNRAKAA
jgi:hypothetical protein